MQGLAAVAHVGLLCNLAPTLNVYSGMPEPQGKNTSDNFVGVIEGP